MDIISLPVSDLHPYEKNAKKHDKTQIDNVAESIRQFGFVQPVVVDAENTIIIGHCRILAAKQLKLKEVPCVRLEGLTEEQVQRLRIVDNKSNESPWDVDTLTEELLEIDLTGFDFDFDFEKENEKENKKEEAKYSEKISIIIDCENENEAEIIFEKLKEDGYNCRVSTL